VLEQVILLEQVTPLGERVLEKVLVLEMVEELALVMVLEMVG